MAKTVTTILTDFRDGKLTRPEMLAAMQAFPWKRVKPAGDPRDPALVEHMDWPQVGTTQEVRAAAATGLISRPDEVAILDVVRSTVGLPHRRE